MEAFAVQFGMYVKLAHAYPNALFNALLRPIVLCGLCVDSL